MTLLFLGLALVLLGGLAAALGRAWPRAADGWFAALVAMGCAVAAGPSFRLLARGENLSLRFDSTLPGGAWVFGLDALSAVFALVVLGVGAAAAWYGAAYLREERGHRPVTLAHVMVSVLIVSLVLVVTARAAMPFLIAWELMTVSAYVLVVFENERAEVRRAGLVYLAATHLGTLLLFTMFALWGANSPDLTFASLALSAHSLPSGGPVVLVLALLGFGVKAGLVPMHFWLPGAHAASPSHVSALMSGVVIKTGIYGLLRVLSLIGPPPAWWGWAVLAIGLVSGVLGVLWALAQHDLKRLLAYHSVENIGIILMGLGMGALGTAYHQPAVAALGYAGAVLHVVNHALFKSLLFLGAGAVGRSTGTRLIDRLGGLARLMPATWLTFALASAAIVGLPPLNGFVSEWLVFQAFLRGGVTEGALRLTVFSAAGLALIGALALACFAKVCGVVFLGHPRSPEAAGAREVGAGMTGPMIVLATACVLAGLLPAVVLPPVLRAAAVVGRIAGVESLAGVSETTAAALWISWSAAGLILAFALGWTLRLGFLRGRTVASAETWGCGFAPASSRMQYTASSFAAPILDGFAPLVPVRVESDANGYSTHAPDPVLDLVAIPWWNRLGRIGSRLRPLHRGWLHVYLLYVVVTVVGLLAYLAVRDRTP